MPEDTHTHTRNAHLLLLLLFGLCHLLLLLLLLQLRLGSAIVTREALLQSRRLQRKGVRIRIRVQ